MASEKFVNNFSTTINQSGGITSTATSVIVTAAFTKSAQFRIIIDNEIILVTAGGTTTTWTISRGQEGTTAATHANGATITHVVTSGALDQRDADNFQSDVIANLPSVERAGKLYLPTDCPVVLRDNGTIWQSFGPICNLTPPVDSDFSWVNQGSATEVVSANGGIFLNSDSPGSGDNWKLRVKSLPAAPYTLTIGCYPIMSPARFTYLGAILYDSASSKFVANGLIWDNTFNYWVVKYTNTTTYSADYLRVLPTYYPGFMFFRFKDDNTNRIASFSPDGINFRTLYSVGRTDFITPDKGGFGVGTNLSSGNSCGMNLLHFSLG